MRWPLLVTMLASGCFSKPGFGGGGPDAAPDARIDADISCWSLVSPTNFEPCAVGFPAATTSTLVLTSGTIDTETRTFNGSGFGVAYTTPDDATVVLVHVGRLEIPIGATVAVTGKVPLVFVSDGDIVVDGILTATKATTAISTGCNAANGPAGPMSGAGGGGGGFGSPGGNGGSSGANPVAGGTGGVVLPGAALTPLVIGCPGAAADMGNMSVGGAGGAGGGAVELAAKGAITITGSIFAGGGGGLMGHGTASFCGAGCSAGGGGGGAGGSILLEATTLTIAMNASVCAAGGGGGVGGIPANGGSNGLDGGCLGGAGGSSANGGHGGKGSESAAAGQAGFNGFDSGPETSGGGGGGGAGRIRFHSPAQTIIATNVAPAPSM